MTLIEIPFVDPVDALLRLSASPALACLDSAMPHETLGRWTYLAPAPTGRFRVVDGRPFWNGEALEEEPLAALRRRLFRPAWRRQAGGPPFQGGAIGHLAYEAGHLFETLPPAGGQSAGEQMAFALYETVLALDVIDRRAFVAAPDEAAARALLDVLRGPPLRRDRPENLVWRDSRTRAAYEAEVARVIERIRDGDIFQANLSHRFTARPPDRPDPVATYLALREANPAPFSALLVDGDRFIASTSPERFLRLEQGRVETRPIKGTARRSPRRAEDEALARALVASEKDRAENVMIVDLLRNDLSRVCRPGTVDVPLLCAVETYASVHHLTSVVTGELRAGRDGLDLLAATFPGGSITGAPKIRAMEIIAELEREPRGAYCGAIGWIGFDGGADFNIAIRTLAYDGRDMTVGAGGGITLLSEPAREYDETLVKAERLLRAFDGDIRHGAGEAA